MKRHPHDGGGRRLPMAEESTILEVELKSTGSRAQRQLNASAGATVAFSIVFLMMAMYFGPSVSQDVGDTIDYETEWWKTPLHLRHTMDLPMDTLRGQLPENGSYEVLPFE